MERNTFPIIPHEVSLKDEMSIQQMHDTLSKKVSVIDMGSGHGDFLIARAREYPEKFFIGIEVSRKRVFKTASRLVKRNIGNFSLIASEGEFALKSFFKNDSIDEIHINFPDPWLRKRQWKNRIFKPSFLIQAIRILKKEGSLYFVTDVEEYAEHTAGILKNFPFLQNDYKKLMEKNIYESFPTLFYQKMSPLRDIHYLKFKKTAQISLN
jgi:tRNA (guanine-N7-)-methyltransferase